MLPRALSVIKKACKISQKKEEKYEAQTEIAEGCRE
jgi:hypothetical protein